MAHCPHCGMEVEAAATVCGHCGQQLTAARTGLHRLKDPLEGPLYEVRIKAYLQQGWELFKQQAVFFVAFFLLMLLIQGVARWLPQVGPLATFVIAAPLSVGPMMVALKLMREQEVKFPDFFGGFQYFLPLLLMSLVGAVIVLIGALPLLGLGFLAGGLAGMILMSLLAGLVITAVLTCYLFAPLLIVERRLDFWPAMEMSRKTVQRRLVEVFAFIALLSLINLAGALLLGVGLIITVPWTWCTLTAAYADIFGLEP